MNFSKLQALIARFNVDTFITQLTAEPTLPIADMSINGEEVEVVGFVDPFFMGTLQRDGIIYITDENILTNRQSDKNIIRLHNHAYQELAITDKQLETLKADKEGALILHGRYVHIISKEHLIKRREYRKQNQQYTEYKEELERIKDTLKNALFAEAVS